MFECIPHRMMGRNRIVLPASHKRHRPSQVSPYLYRARLVAKLDRGGSGAVVDSTPAEAATQSAAAGAPPDAFVVCAACHTVTPDGAPGISPNLHGVIGHKAGAAPGFSFSSAMMSAGFQWSRESLDEYLTSPAAKVPGNYMMYLGQPDAAERKAIIDYLESLR